MQAPNPQPHIVVARSVIEVLQQATMEQAMRPASDHGQSTGGILIGKRLSDSQIAVVAASTPGPAPDNRQLGFALDQAHANATLEAWFTRDATVDFVGLWHTHPRELARPPVADVQVAQKLLADPASTTIELVNLIVEFDQRDPQIRCFYLRQDAASMAAVSFVPYEVLDDTHPFLLMPSVAEAPSLPASEVATPEPLPTMVQPSTLRAVALVGLLAVLLVVLVLVGRELRLGGNTAGNGQVTATSGTQASAGMESGTTPAPAIARTTAPAIASATTLPAATSTRSSVTAEPAAIVATTPSPLPAASPSPVPSLQATAGPLYALRLQPMDAAYRQDFLNRLRVATCVGCYNVDLVSPVPFREMRIKIAGIPEPPLSTYSLPSPADFPARSQPYTVQAFDLQGNSLSDPVTFTIASGALYVLRITPLTGGAGG